MQMLLPVEVRDAIASFKAVQCTPTPDDIDVRLANGESVNISYSISLEPTEEFQNWAAEAGIPFSFHLDNENMTLFLEEEDHIMWFKLRWWK